VLVFFAVLLSLALVAVSLFSILVVLMQKSPEGGGFGSSLGGGAMESIFGGDAGDVLVRTTAKATIAFLALSMLLSMCYVHQAGKVNESNAIRLPERSSTAEVREK
jgi:protein translocase SecG subunit